jgi:hypothetical protein
MENNDCYDAGWAWCSDRIHDFSPGQIKSDANGASYEFDDPDAFYEGALDCLEKNKK